MARFTTPVALAVLAFVCTTTAAQPVHPDPTYSDGGDGGFSFSTRASALDSQDRLVVLSTSGISPKRITLNRYAEGGNDDSTFVGGVVDLPRTHDWVWPSVSLVLSEDRPLVISSIYETGEPGPSTWLSWFTEDGEADTTRVPEGRRRLVLPGEALVRAAVAVGDRVMVGLESGSAPTPRSCSVAAVLPSGELDPAFGSGGVVSIGNAAECGVGALAEHGNGVLVLVTETNGDSQSSAVYAIDANGALQSEFGVEGVLRLQLPEARLNGARLVDWGDRFVAVGGYLRGDEPGVALHAFAPDGTADLTFGEGGRTLASLEGFISYQPYPTGATTPGHALAVTLSASMSYYESGLLIGIFERDGRQRQLGGPRGYYFRQYAFSTSRSYGYGTSGAVVDSQGRLVVVGAQLSSGSGNTSMRKSRYVIGSILAADAPPTQGLALAPDVTFGLGGVLELSGSGGHQVEDLHLDEQDRTTLVRFGGSNTLTRYHVGRLTSDGALDPEHLSPVRTPTRALVERGFDPRFRLARQGDELVLVGNAVIPYVPRPFSARLRPAGQIDTLMVPGGHTFIPTPYEGASVQGLSVHPNGAWIALQGRSPDTPGGLLCQIVSILPSGAVDPSFGSDGFLRLADLGDRCSSRDLVEIPGGMALLVRLGPDSTAVGLVAAFDFNGTPLESFGANGRATLGIEDGAVLPDRLLRWGDRLIVGGRFQKDGVGGFAVHALTLDGAPDGTFYGGGAYFGTPSGVMTPQRIGLTATSTGLLVAASSVQIAPDEDGLAVTAFDATGLRRDLGGTDGFYYRNLSDPVREIDGYESSVMASDSEGRLLIAGSQTWRGSYRFARVDRYVIDLNAVGQEEVLSDVSEVELRVAPNPASDAVRIRFALRAPESSARVRVVDALGRTLATMVEGALGVGEHELRLETGTFANGVYLIVAELGSVQRTARFVLSR